jgi:hypothetical protein
MFHEKRGDRGKRNMLHVEPEAWAAATHVSVSGNLQCIYCAIARVSCNNRNNWVCNPGLDPKHKNVNLMLIVMTALV